MSLPWNLPARPHNRYPSQPATTTTAIRHRPPPPPHVFTPCTQPDRQSQSAEKFFMEVSAGLAAGVVGRGSRSVRAATRRPFASAWRHLMYKNMHCTHHQLATSAHHATLSPTTCRAPRRAQACWCLVPMRWWRGRQGRKFPAPSAHRTLCMSMNCEGRSG